MRRLPLPGWVLALSLLMFVLTWITAPRDSVSGSTRLGSSEGPTPLPARAERAAPPVLDLPPGLGTIDDVMLRSPVLVSQPHRIAFTFDDGPHHLYTAQLLRTLAAHGVRATFFVNGCWLLAGAPHADESRRVLLRAHQAGHLIGNHGVNHLNLGALPHDQQTWEIVANEELIESVTGQRPFLFRPPYAVLSQHLRGLLLERDYLTVRWNAAASDEGMQRPEEIRDTVMLWLRHHEGGIVMLHDRHRASVEAVPLILEALDRENATRSRLGQPMLEVVPLDSFQLRPPQSGTSAEG